MRVRQKVNKNKMTGSADGNTITASMSGVPSIMNSLNSLASSKLSVHSRPKSPEAEEVIAELLEKAKFYTSLCLGMYCCTLIAQFT